MRFLQVARALVLATGVLLLATTPARAQSYQGGIRGRVLDPGGASIPTATVALINEATNAMLTTISNVTGEYNFPKVDPGKYTLTAEIPGFKKFSGAGIEVLTQQFITLDVTMQVGEVTESVMVTEQIPVIETATASQGTVLDRQKLEDLPNTGRNPFMMAMVVPGVVPNGNPRFNRMQDQSGSSQVSIAGGPMRGNNYLLDGVPITDSQNRAVIVPTIEAVAEVNIQSNTYDAEVGRTGGGTYNALLKSGTNDLHGAAFGYYRPGGLAANDFFNNRAGIARPNGLSWKNYGFGVGGPLVLPKVYNGRNRTFFWIAGEAYRQKSNNTTALAIPTMLERSGDFSQSFAADKTLRTIFDPMSATSGNRTPFPGNIIPASLQNPVGAKAASFWPTPTASGLAYGANNFTAPTVIFDRADQVTGKLDHQFTDWLRMNVSYLHYGSTETGERWYGTIATTDGWTLHRWVDTTQANAVMTPTATTVVSVRYGFNRFPNDSGNVSAGYDPTELGFPSSLVNQFQVRQFPGFTLQDFNGIGNNGNSQTVFNSKNFLTSISKFAGKHNIKAGFDYRRINQPFIDFGSNGTGTYAFNQNFTAINPNRPAGTGSSVASLLLGYPDNGSVRQTTKFNTFVNYYGFYVQDDYRVTSKLTLNLGLRYEYETGLREANNNFTWTFDRTVTNPIQATAAPGTIARGGLVYAGIDGAPTEQGNPSAAKYSPRIGIAYRLNEKTTIRTGYGIYWAPTRYETSPAGIGAEGFTRDTAFATTDPYIPQVNLSNPFPNGLLQPVGNSLGLLTNIGGNVPLINPDRRGGMVQQFSFDIQRELPGSIGLELAYIGSRSSRLQYAGTGSGSFNINALDPAYFAQGSAALAGPVANPFAGSPYAAGVIGGATIPLNRALRPFPEFNAVTAYYMDGNRARYDSLVVKAQKRYSNGLTFLSSFTWTKAYDATFGEGNTYSGTAGSPQNPYDLSSEYSLSSNLAPFRLVSSFTYELPFGKGKSFLSTSNKVANYLVAGWSFNGISTIQSGFFSAITQNTNNNGAFGYERQRPNATGSEVATSGSLSDRIDGWFSPAAFSVAPQGAFGNTARTLPVRGPGQIQWDMSMFKTAQITEKIRAQFRFEAINAMNTPVFRGPANAYGAGSFGTLTRQANFPRQLQFGLRFLW